MLSKNLQIKELASLFRNKFGLCSCLFVCVCVLEIYDIRVKSNARTK